MKFLSISEKHTFNFAKKFSKNLKGGEILGLVGNLGAGKTIFTKGLAAGLGVKKLASPTFVLMKIYPARQAKIKLLVHLDAYRLKSAKSLAAIGAIEYFQRPDAVMVIEWAEKIKKILPKKTKFVKIAYREDQSRIIKTDCPSKYRHSCESRNPEKNIWLKIKFFLDPRFHGDDEFSSFRTV